MLKVFGVALRAFVGEPESIGCSHPEEFLAVLNIVVTEAAPSRHRVAVGGVPTHQIQGEVPDDGQILSRVLGAGLVGILTE